MLTVTEQAVTKVKELLAKDEREGYGLRVAVRGGGCSGFEYGLTWENQQQDNDTVMEFDGLKVYVDAMSNLYLDGVQIDYVDGLVESGFKIENPNATGTCGCGHSFSV
jgi:iron-sulfur cluster assembly accessory protein